MHAGRLALTQGQRTLLGWGSAYPGEAISTEALCAHIERHFDIPTRRFAKFLAGKLGVETRYLCRDFSAAQESPRAGARNPELAAQAMKLALERAQLSADGLAYVISHTTTPAQLLPAGSAEIARLMGHTGAHMELRQACTGFANALQIAFAMTAHRDAAPVGIVGVETGSVYFDPNSLRERSAQWVNFLQMGDGAAAVVIGPDTGDSASPMIHTAYFGQGQQPPKSGLRLTVGGSDNTHTDGGTVQFEHDYDSVMQEGVALLQYGRDVLASEGYLLQESAWVVPHQASGALALWLAKRWDLQQERVSAHGARVGNLGSASLWAGLDDVLRQRSTWTGRHALFLGAEATQYSYGGFVVTLPRL
jgi:3-oxoacyl-[acyl-carrier-protein] synthase III